MTSCSPAKLVIFDYSGTLSLEAPRFARPANLLSAFAESGLARLGVATPETFWGDIVGPTWTEGSTTTIGYKRVMTQRIETLGLAPGTTGAEIAAAASRFADLYFAHSQIAPLWRPLLETLTGNPAACVVIATDHYAEATETIIHNLHSWNIPARKAGEEAQPCRRTGNETIPYFGRRQTTTDEEGVAAPGFVRKNRNQPSLWIANSADIGFWKADRRFWEIVKLQLAITAIRSVLIIDDFGFNEEQGDSYGTRAGVEARQKETAASLQETFQTSLTVIPFFLKSGERDREEAGAQRIAETVRQIDCFLNPGEVTENAP